MKMLRPMLKPADTRAAHIPEKTADPWYLTPEHRAWREQVIARAGGVCQRSGCGRKEQRMFANHIVEIKDGGARLDPANGECLCGRHHSLVTIAERRRRLSHRGAPRG
jgi:hypothetical protein